MKMKCAAAALLIALAFVSQAFAVLRPLFPIKPTAPFNGELIVIGDDFVLRPATKAAHASPRPGAIASAWTAGYGLHPRGLSLTPATAQSFISSRLRAFRRHQLNSRHSLATGL